MSPAVEAFHRYRVECPIIAILRGIAPDEVVPVGEALLSAGIRIIEIPLNSPDPFESIRRLSKSVGGQGLVGAGTVLDVDQVARVEEAGGRLVVSPNTDAAVIKKTVVAGLVSVPGYFTPSEAFAAIAAGAHGIKLFPAEAATPAVVKAQRAVLPNDVPLLVVGGVTADDFGRWLAAGADGFGLGGALYRAGDTVTQVHQRAARFVAALKPGARQ